MEWKTDFLAELKAEQLERQKETPAFHSKVTPCEFGR
jgi:hypothetical protein